MTSFNLGLAQIKTRLGDVRANLDKHLAYIDEAAKRDVDVLVFPELSLTGYVLQDLVPTVAHKPSAEDPVFKELLAASRDRAIDLVVGFVDEDARSRFFIGAAYISRGEVVHVHHKVYLPTYTMFHDGRFFAWGDSVRAFDTRFGRFGVLICEDAWFPEPAAAARAQGAQILLVLNASPYHQGKRADRAAVLGARALENGVPLVYCNLIGGQDDLLFDGQSMLFAADGSLTACAPAFAEHLLLIDVHPGETVQCHPVEWPPQPREPAEAEVYRALVRATGDYVRKNGFTHTLLGLSGGIDSALTLAIAVDALGADRVAAVRLPSRYTSSLSNDEALAQAQAQGVRIETLPIETPVQAFLDTLAPVFAGRAPDLTEENLQARCRGVLLMAMSNKFGGLLLTTGNKSEMAVGYSTIYGDMCGGFAPLKDVYKTQVYALARWRNTLSKVIPEAVIERAPSAELRENQTDQDSLPPYPELDDILRRFIELDQPRAAIVAAGHDPATVARVTGLVLKNEYKRRQSAPGPRVTARSFGRDRRFPISSGYR